MLILAPNLFFMQTASFVGTIETILYIIAIYYAIKFLSRLLFPVLIKKVVEKAGQNFNQQYNSQNNQNYQSQNRDEIIYDTQKTTKPRSTKIVGEYVDYEEID